jgi:hypothetical protein
MSYGFWLVASVTVGMVGFGLDWLLNRVGLHAEEPDLTLTGPTKKSW